MFGLAAFNGWPDTDGDGVTDNVNKCIDKAGPASNNGCPVEPTVEVMSTLNEYARTILFDIGEANFHKEFMDILKSMTAIFKEYPQADLVIEGHTDSVGSERSNQLLSERRANTVRDYLIPNGIDADKLTAIGYGESKPIDSNATASGRVATDVLKYLKKNYDYTLFRIVSLWRK